jgi:hypothetical protein
VSENIKSEAISRRKAFSLLGLAAAFSFAVPAAVLSLSDDAEAQTTTTTTGTLVNSGAPRAARGVRSGAQVARSAGQYDVAPPPLNSN